MFYIKQIQHTDTYLEVEVLGKKFLLHYRKGYDFHKTDYTDTYLQVSILEKSFLYITEKDMFFIKQIQIQIHIYRSFHFRKKVSVTLQKRICFS